MKAELTIIVLSILRALITYVFAIALGGVLVRMDSTLVLGRMWSFLIVLCLCVLWFSYSYRYFNKLKFLFCGLSFLRRVVIGVAAIISIISDLLFVLIVGYVIYLCCCIR